jgi:hypothetical protein
VQLGRIMYLPYQLVRRPLGVIDEHAVRRLSSDNPLRTVYEAGLRMADTAAALLLDEPGLVGSDELKRDADAPSGGSDQAVPDQPTAESPQRSPERQRAEEQRRHDFAVKEEQVTRSNRSPATMARDLNRVRAVEEAREHEADGQAEPPS